MTTATSPRTTRRALGLGAIALALTSAMACGGDDEADEPEPTTTTASTTSTSTPTAEGPAEWVEVVQDIYNRDFALLEDPDPARVSEVYAETCNCWDSRLGTVEFLASEGQSLEGAPARVVSVELEQADDVNDFVDLTVRIQAEAQRRLDSDGNLVQEFPAETEPSCVSLTLRPDGADGAYRVHTQLSLTDCGAEE